MVKIDRQVGDYLEYCEKVRCMSDATVRMKRNVLGRFVKVTGLDDLNGLTNGVFNAWVANEVARGVSHRSVNAYNAVILAMTRYFVGVGVAEIKKMIGHESLVTMERYLYGFDGRLMELFDKYR